MKQNKTKLLEVLEKLKKEKGKLPFQLNVIDELHINENAHSRILQKLLQYRTPDGKFELLQSLINYIKTKKMKFSAMPEIVSPEIMQEEARIDLWVRDRDYAIIFENKVYDANDKEAQLERYINITKELGYDLSQIYVVYLSSRDGHGPDTQTWGSYKEEFEPRYVNLSFSDDIRAWLKRDVLPNLRNNRNEETLLISAVVQYADYLDGLFSQRDADKIVNYLDKSLGYNNAKDWYNMVVRKDKAEQLIALLNESKGEEALEDALEEALRKAAEAERKALTAFLKTKYSDHLNLETARDELKTLIENDLDAADSYIKPPVAGAGYQGGVLVPYDGKMFLLSIGYRKGWWYCQLEEGCGYNFDSEALKEIRAILDEKYPQCILKTFKGYDNVLAAYHVFKQVLCRMQGRGVEMDGVERDELKALIKSDFPKMAYYSDPQSGSQNYGGLILNYDGTEFLLYVGYDGQWYCQLEVAPELKAAYDFDSEAVKGIRAILDNSHGGNNSQCIWKYLALHENNMLGAYRVFKQVAYVMYEPELFAEIDD